jgi:ATP-dependent RNA helicase DDX3X
MHIINFDLPSTMHGGIDEYVHRIGRTARIGNEGLATSFYNDRNVDLAENLVKILIESNQPVPDFLSQYAPEDNKVVWDDNSDEEAPEDEEKAKSNASDAGTTSGKEDKSSNGAASAEKVEAEAPADKAADKAVAEATTSSDW